jgi:hypothetical protein
MKSNGSKVKTLVRKTSMQMNFPGRVSDSLVVQTHSVISCPGGWSQTIFQMKKPDVVLSWRGCTWYAVVRPVGHTAKFSTIMLYTAYGREIKNVIIWKQLWWTFETSVALCDKTAHFRLVFYCP